MASPGRPDPSGGRATGSPTTTARGTTRTRSGSASIIRRRPADPPADRARRGTGPSGRRPRRRRASSAAIQVSSAARTSRSPSAIAGAFVAAIPAPISGEPRARRVMLAQPLATRPDSSAQSGRSGPSGGPTTASTSAVARTSGTWLIAATARSWVAASRRIGRPPVARASASTRSAPPAGDVAPGTTIHGRSRNRSALDAPKPVASEPAIGWPPTNGRPASAAASTIAPSCSRRRSRRRPGRADRAARQGAAGCRDSRPAARPGSRDRRRSPPPRSAGRRHRPRPPRRPRAVRRPWATRRRSAPRAARRRRPSAMPGRSTRR